MTMMTIQSQVGPRQDSNLRQPGFRDPALCPLRYGGVSRAVVAAAALSLLRAGRNANGGVVRCYEADQSFELGPAQK